MPTNNDHNWTSFEKVFSHLFLDRFPYVEACRAPASCAWELGKGRGHLEDDYRRVEAKFPAVERTIRALCDERAASIDDSPEVSYFIGLRAAVLQQFLLDLAPEISSTQEVEITSTIIPFPALPFFRVAEWLLIEWWRDCGPRRVCQLRCLHETIPPFAP